MDREKKGKKKENMLANAYGLKPKWGEKKGPKKKPKKKTPRIGLNRQDWP